MPYADPAKYKAYQKRYRNRNRAKAKAYHAEWRKRNPEKIREASRKGNARYTKAQKAAFARSWRRRNWDREYAIQCRRRARLLDAPVNDFTSAQWVQLKKEFKHCCAYCGKRKRLTRDHVIPLSKGGSHTLTNIVPACQSCNSSKGTKARPTA